MKLSRRLTELQDNGLITQRELPPPGTATVYQLTDHGRTTTIALEAEVRIGWQ